MAMARYTSVTVQVELTGNLNGIFEEAESEFRSEEIKAQSVYMKLGH
jgi:hypothetical protein